jgi:hypothetical protein
LIEDPERKIQAVVSMRSPPLAIPADKRRSDTLGSCVPSHSQWPF